MDLTFQVPMQHCSLQHWILLLSLVKKEMARVNVDILGISKLKWNGMGKFNPDDNFIYYCGQESLRRNGVAFIVNKRVEMQYLCAISKITE